MVGEEETVAMVAEVVAAAAEQVWIEDRIVMILLLPGMEARRTGRVRRLPALQVVELAVALLKMLVKIDVVEAEGVAEEGVARELLQPKFLSQALLAPLHLLQDTAIQ